MRRKSECLLLSICLLFLSSGLALADEQSQPQETVIPDTLMLEEKAYNQPEVSWLWGEVIALDVQNKTLGVKYLDYDTESYKEINVTADESTVYENLKALDELKPEDTISLDYTVNPDGKNVAKNISLEKPEAGTGEQQSVPGPDELPKDEANQDAPLTPAENQ